MERKKILIIEDKKEFRDIYGDRLRFGGFDILEAGDGGQALKLLSEQHVDLIMTDLNMPNMDGFEFITETKKDEKIKNIPIIVMSVFDRQDYVKKALELGANDYLVKGMHTPNDVLDKVKNLLEK